MRIHLPSKVQYFIALLTGAITTLAFAPFEQFYLAFITPSILFLLLANKTTKQAAIIGWLFGLGFFGTGISWVYVSINTYGGTHWFPAGLITLLFCAAMSLLLAVQSIIYQKYFSYKPLNWVGFAALWLLFEWLRSWLFTGFPWLYLGYTVIDTPLAPLAAVGGVWLLSLLTILPGLALAAQFKRYKTQSIIRCILPSGAIVISLALLIIMTPKNWTKVVGKPLSVAIMQPDIPQEIKWKRRFLPDILDRYYKTTEPLLGTDLIIWPETAIPAFYPQVEGYFSALVSRQKSLGGHLVTGLPSQVLDRQDPDRTRIHNSVANLTNGSVYHKQRLVPFGEYVPYEDELRGLINFLDIPTLTFSLPQRQQQEALVVGDYNFSTAICYEIAYPELVRRNSKNVDVMLTVSNDTWFSYSIGPDQHFQIARMRAIENGRWLIRSANNGITAIVEPTGKVSVKAPRYTQAVLKGSVEARQGETPYQKVGQWPIVIFCFLMLGASLRRPRSDT